MSDNKKTVKQLTDFVVHIDGVNYPVSAENFDEAIKLAKELAKANEIKDTIEESK